MILMAFRLLYLAPNHLYSTSSSLQFQTKHFFLFLIQPRQHLLLISWIFKGFSWIFWIPGRAKSRSRNSSVDHNPIPPDFSSLHVRLQPAPFLQQNPTVKKKKDHNNTFLFFFFSARLIPSFLQLTHLPQQHVLLLILLLAFVSFITSWIESVVPESPGSNGERKSRSSKTGVRCQQSNPARFLPACNHY